MSDLSKRLIEYHVETMRRGLDLLVDLLNQSTPAAATITVASPPPVITFAPPKKKAAKKAKRKYTRRAPEVDAEDDDLDDDDDDLDDDDDDSEPAQKMTPAISMGDATKKVGVYLGKLGLYQQFTGDDVRAKVFPDGIGSDTLTYALNQWINRGVLERVERGNAQKPSKFKKVKQIEGED